MVAINGVGHDRADTGAMRERDVRVTNTPDIADLAIALMLNAVRALPAAELHGRSGHWPKSQPGAAAGPAERSGCAPIARQTHDENIAPSRSRQPESAMMFVEGSAMNDIESDYLAAAAAYQAQQPGYLQAGKEKRMHRISEDDYRVACALHRNSRQALDHAEAAWIASWR